MGREVHQASGAVLLDILLQLWGEGGSAVFQRRLDLKPCMVSIVRTIEWLGPGETEGRTPQASIPGRGPTQASQGGNLLPAGFPVLFAPLKSNLVFPGPD